MVMHISNLDIGLVVGFFGGIGSFFKGFRAYRTYLLLQGTPEIPISSISIGLVRIHGRVASERLVTSPISHTPCCFYQVKIEKWKSGGEDGTWSHYGSEADGVKFYLEDSSGRVLVDAHGAEYDIDSTEVREASSGTASTFAARGASGVELLGYAARVGPSAEAPESQHNFEMERALVAVSKYTKRPTTPDELFQGLVGPQVARIRQQFENEGPYSDPVREELRLAQIDLYTHPFWSPEYAEGFKRVTRLQEQVRKAGPSVDAPPQFPKQPPPLPSSADEIVTPIDGPPGAHGRYRFTERCILPGQEYDITGTCTENPEATDGNDRHLLRKGSSEPTYLIAALARSDVNTMLRMRTQLLIFGGGMLAVFCLGLLLLRFGLF